MTDRAFRLQVIADGSLENYAAEIQRLFPGSSIVVAGGLSHRRAAVRMSRFRRHSVKVLGFCEPTDYPLQKQRVSFERLREVAHLRARTNTFGAVRARARRFGLCHSPRFSMIAHFRCLHTPVITASDCEGAGEMFQVTTMDLADIAAKGKQSSTTMTFSASAPV